MDVKLTNSEIVFVYGHFRKEAHKLVSLKAKPDCPIDKSTIQKDIDLYNSIADKFLDAYPGLSKLDKHDF